MVKHLWHRCYALHSPRLSGARRSKISLSEVFLRVFGVLRHSSIYTLNAVYFLNYNPVRGQRLHWLPFTNLMIFGLFVKGFRKKLLKKYDAKQGFSGDRMEHGFSRIRFERVQRSVALHIF